MAEDKPTAFEVIIDFMNGVLNLIRRPPVQSDFVLVPGEPEEVLELPKGSAVVTVGLSGRDLVPRPAPVDVQRAEETPCFDAIAVEWAMTGRELPVSVARLVRVPSGAMAVLADRAAGSKHGSGRSVGEGPSNPVKPTREPRRAARKSGNPAKRAAAEQEVLRQNVERARDAVNRELERRRNGL